MISKKENLSVVRDYFLGKRIKNICLSQDEENTILFDLASGHRVALCDAAQYCCEERYFHTDDDINIFIDAEITGLELTPVQMTEIDRYTCHDFCFLRISTNVGALVFSAHNKHNGYYAGFDIQAKLFKEDKSVLLSETLHEGFAISTLGGGKDETS